ncbi:hypothetical protein [Cohnella sp. GCM10027633]|uniref:hypothetical protein n=1 Tax=unclassified Cohnella TaxID=2636738 RepID=UPI00363BCE7A
MNRLLKLFGLISGIALLDIVVLSPGLFGVSIGGDNALESAFGVTFVFMSVLALLYGTYALLLRPPDKTSVRELQTSDDYIEALRRHKHVKALKADIGMALEQIDRMNKKHDALLSVLGQRFDPSELSYKRFGSVIRDVHSLFYLNIRGIVNKLTVFDAAEYDKFAGEPRPAHLSDKLVRERSELYRQYTAYVSGAVGANEEILLKLDKLLLEVSRLDSTDYETIEAMPGMIEIDELIRQTKFYRS